MLIEAAIPLRIRLRSGEVRMRPGQPAEFTEEDGLRLLVKAKGKVRLIPHQPIDWLYEWRILAAMTSGLMQDDSRLLPVMTALGRCDDAFLAGDFVAFTLAAARVQETMRGR